MRHYKINKKRQNINRLLPPNVSELPKVRIPRRLFTKIHPVERYKLIDPKPINIAIFDVDETGSTVATELSSDIRNGLAFGFTD